MDNINMGRCSGSCANIDPKVGDMMKKNAEAAKQQSAFSKKLVVTSGCRSASHNQAVSGRSNGGHVRGTAIDSNPEDRNCVPYKAMAEKANGKTFITCFHGTAPHLHMDSNSPPCNNCGKETDYKRKPEDQQQPQQSPGGGSPSGGSPGGGGSPSGGGQPEKAQYPQPRYEDRNAESLMKAIDTPAQSKAPVANKIGKPVFQNPVDVKKADPKDPSQITKTDDPTFGHYSGAAGPVFGAGGFGAEDVARNSNNAKPDFGGASSGGGGLGGGGGGSGGGDNARKAPSDSSNPYSSSYAGSGGSGGGGGGGGGGGATEITSPFGKPLSNPKMNLPGSETSALANNLVNELTGGARDPASKGDDEQGEIGDKNGAPLFERVHSYLERCQSKGCVMRAR